MLWIITSFTASSVVLAQDTSDRLFNIYANSAVHPEYFDGYVAQEIVDEQLRSCIGGLTAIYAPIAQRHLNGCWGIADWQAKRMCMDQAPPEAHVGDWLISLQHKLGGTPWCDTSTGWSACFGKRMVGPDFWESMVTPFFPVWRQYLQC